MLSNGIKITLKSYFWRGNVKIWSSCKQRYRYALHCITLQNMYTTEWFIDFISDVSLTVKAATLIFISGSGSAISSSKQGKSRSIYNLLKYK